MQGPFPVNISKSVFAFRGYNVTNLGRTPELLAIPAYQETITTYLQTAGRICSEVVGRKVDLVGLVRDRVEPTLREYPETIALVVAVELAQLQLLREHFDVEFAKAMFVYGYSLGELSAVMACGVFALEETLRVPLTLAEDCAALAADIRMGILFSRGVAIDQKEVLRQCQRITAEGNGTICMSAVLSPNTLLLLGQRETMARFEATMHEVLPHKVHLRKNDNRWPPLHTPIVRSRCVVDRASVMLETMPGGFVPACPLILSLVTGKLGYADYDARGLLRDWIDHPQRLWDAVYETLASGAETVIHVGPEPNLIPATFRRIRDNVRQQLAGRSLGSLGLKAVSGMAGRPWLATVLPMRAALLRAPSLQEIVLEDWLIEHQPG